MRSEDYDLAMALKEISDKLKILGHKLLQLERQKAEAIEGEDFMTAKAIKHEETMIYAEIDSVNPLDPFGTQKNTVEQSFN